MSKSLRNVALIGRQNTQGVSSTLSKLIDYLEQHKINVILEEETAAIVAKKNVLTVSRDQLKKYCEAIIVVGGDGSLLSAAQIAAKQHLPVVGVNRGRLGFLTDISPTNLNKICEILKGNYNEERRFLLEATLRTNHRIINRHLALNEVVLLSSSPGKMIEFSVYVAESFLCAYRADGLIIASPTGSTAHALSGGGPILHPTLEAFIILPMLSHNLSSRPIVIKSNDSVKITFKETNVTDVIARCDGQIQTTIHSGIIQIKKAKEKLRILHPLDYDYFETLRTKLHWETI